MNQNLYKLLEEPLHANFLKFFYGESKRKGNNFKCFQKNPSLFSTNVVGQPIYHK